MARISLDLTSDLPPDLLRRMDCLAGAAAAQFNAMLDDASRGRERDLHWWMTQPRVRNTHVSPLFDHCLKLALIRALLDEGDAVEVITDDPAVAEALSSAPSDRLSVRLNRRPGARRKALKTRLKHVASSLFNAGAGWLGARLTRHRRKPLPDAPLTVLDVMLLPESLASGRFRDRYYPGILDGLSDQERRLVAYAPIPYRIRRFVTTYTQLRQAPETFLIREDWLGAADYLFAFSHWIRSHFGCPRGLTFAGFAVDALVRADLGRGRYCNSVIAGLLTYRCWRNMRRAGVKVRRVIDWFEGQDIDRGLAAAIHWHWPEVDLIGYRGTIASPLFLSTHPTPGEIGAGIVPRTIALIGEGQEPALRESSPGLTLTQAPALRYERLWTLKAEAAADGPAEILVTLPITMETAALVVSTVFAVAGTDFGRPVRWSLRPHPATPLPSILAMVPGPHPEFHVSTGDFYDHLGRSHLVVGAASATLLEAVATGIPALCVAGGSTFTENPIPADTDPRMWRICYGVDEVRAAVAQLLAAGPRSGDRALLARHVNPVTPEGKRALLGFAVAP